MSQSTSEDQIITINSEVNEIFAKTEITQKYTNLYSFPIEIKLQFPILPFYTLTKFTVILDNKIITSKILEAERGKEKFNDEIASGNTAFYGSIFDSGEKMEIYIGNLYPTKILELKTEYLQIINSEDMSFCFSLIQSYPKMCANKSDIIMKGIKCNIYLKTQSALTRFILLNKRKDINYITDFSPNLDYAKLFFEKKYVDNTSFKSLPYSVLKIIFRTENIQIPILYSQFNEEKNESSYVIRYMHSNNDIPSRFSEKIKTGNYNDLNFFSSEDFIDMDPKVSYNEKYRIKNIERKSYPCCYIFIIDQSGSMKGEKIEILRQALILFLKSLPFGSYFQIIGFGSCCIKYNKEPIIYNEKNIKEIIKLIKDLSANLGGTNLVNPLIAAFEQKNEVDLPKNVIIITDGKVNNVGRCIDLIKENNNYYIVHCLGIGEDYNKYFVEETAKAGKGLKFFIKNVKGLFYDIFKILNIFSQEYIQNINIDILNNNEYFKNSKYNIFLNSYYITENDFITYGFICPGKFYSSEDKKIIKVNINLKKNNIKDNKEVDINETELLNNGEELGKIIVGSFINKVSSNKNLTENDIINLSKNYQILSKYTCFFGSFENSEKNDTSGLINLEEFYLPDDQGANVNISYPKTGKHGHAKKIITRLNEEEIKYSDLIEDNFDNNENNSYIENVNDFNLIKKIIEEQNINDGSWEKKIVNGEKYNEIYIKINDYFNKQNMDIQIIFKKICCTYYIIYILNEKFDKYINFWKQVAIKGMYFLQNNGIDYDKIKIL